MYTPDVVIYHNPCDDGWMSQLVVADYISRNKLPTPAYIPASYANVDAEYWREVVRDKNVLVVDFSFKNPLKGAIEAACASMVILDHHDTAQKILGEDIVQELTLDNVQKHIDTQKIVAFFDMKKCGSRLAWEFLNPGKELPILLEYVDYQDRGIRMDRGSDFTYWLRSRPDEYRTPDKIEFLRSLEDTSDFEQALDDGHVIAQYAESVGDDLVQTAMRAVAETEDGRSFKIAYTIGSYSMASMVAMKLASRPDVDIGIVFYQMNIPDRPYGMSMRSVGTGAAKELAEALGGGGHPNAAGVNMTVDEYLDLIDSLHEGQEESNEEGEG